MAKKCVKCGKTIPFLEGKRHPEGMYCTQCDIEDFVARNCSSKEFMEQVRKDAAPTTDATPVPSERQSESQLSPVDELRKCKELLDDGIITQEEFDAKKRQLLGL